MITFKKLRYKNFLSSGNTFTEIELDTNPQTLIIGANGAGKSTVIDAIFYSLYGECYRDINKAQIINSINKKQMVVELDFFVGSDGYKIRRGIKPDLFEIYKNGSLLDQDGKALDHQNALETQILKMNKKTFRQIVVIGKTDYTPFMKLTTPKRREFIENLLDIEVFSVMNNILKTDISGNKNNLSNVDRDITIMKEKIRLEQEHLEKIQKNRGDIIKDLKENIDVCQGTIADLQIDLQEIQTKIDEKSKNLPDEKKLRELINEVTNIESKLRDRVSKLEKEISFFEENDDCPTCKQPIDNHFKCETVKEKNKTLVEVSGTIEELKKKREKFNTKYTEATALLSEINQLEKKLSSINNDITLQNRMISRYNQEIEKHLAEKEQETDTNQVTKLQEELSKLENTKQKLIDEKNVFDIVAILLKDTGIKSRMIKKYIPKINSEINKYLGIMDLFVNFEINENFEETIKSRHRDAFSYSSFSEGEKQRIDLALLFTWRSVAKMRSGNVTNLLFFDETLDGSLDEQGINDFLKIINDLTKGTNTFIISHNTDTIDKFSNVIRFKKEKNFSVRET